MKAEIAKLRSAVPSNSVAGKSIFHHTKAKSQTQNIPNIEQIEPMRIALCSPELHPLLQAMKGEPTNATYLIQRHIATRLKARGHDLTFIAQLALGENICTDSLDDLTVAPRTWSGSRWFNFLRKLTWQVQRFLCIPYLNVYSNLQLFDACLHCLPGHDLVYERSGLYRHGVAKACKYLHLPYVLYVEADEILEYDYMQKPITGLLRWRAQKIFQFNLDAADCIVCVSQPLKAHLTKIWNIQAEKIFVFPNGVDAEQFRPNPEQRAKIRDHLKVSTNPLILFVGNFYEWHDVAILLDAFSQILKSYPDTRLVLVGEGSTRNIMEERAAALGITYAVQFTGLLPHADVPHYAAAADIAVVPYPPIKHDLWFSPLKLFEYMASAKAIVASAIGQLPDIVKDGRNCLLVPPGNIQALVNAVQRLIDDSDLREGLGNQAREDAILKHSWENYITNLEHLFVDVIDSKSNNSFSE